MYHFLTAPTEHRIQIDFVEQFDIRPSSSCNLAGVELKDGGTDFSPSIGNKIVIFCTENFHEKNFCHIKNYNFGYLFSGTFCNSRPPTQKSSGNVMRIKYYTNSDHPNLGFKAKISIATCGGTMHVTSKAISHATSPSFPDSYPENTECLWNIIGPEGHYLKFDFDTFNLELPGSVDNCTDVDRLGTRNTILKKWPVYWIEYYPDQIILLFHFRYTRKT